jgi:uncharacterized circularly permuted ATP-grasp superfamily protein
MTRTEQNLWNRYDEMLSTETNVGPEWKKLCEELGCYEEARYMRLPTPCMTLDNQDLILAGLI